MVVEKTCEFLEHQVNPKGNHLARQAVSATASGAGGVNRGPREANPAGLRAHRHCSVRKRHSECSPWGRKPTARSEECQGGHWDWRQGSGKEETRGGTSRGGQGCVAAGLEDSAVPSEMEQWEVSAGQA